MALFLIVSTLLARGNTTIEDRVDLLEQELDLQSRTIVLIREQLANAEKDVSRLEHQVLALRVRQ